MQTAGLRNMPDIWARHFEAIAGEANKYSRGHAVVFGAPELTGATRLAAGACSRIGAGLVTVLAKRRADVYRTSLPADIMVRDCAPDVLTHVSVMLAGPGGLEDTHRLAFNANALNVSRVFDASAIPDDCEAGALNAQCVLTPHEGEFRRAFPDLRGDKIDRALASSRLSGAVVVLKGPRTVIAHPDGRVVVNDRPNLYLAKGGTGDVLAGLLTGLVAQGFPTFDAACAAVWIHSEAGERLGPGLTACDLEHKIPEILKILCAPLSR